MTAKAWWPACPLALIVACASPNAQLKGTFASPDSSGEVRTAQGRGDQTQLTVTVYNLPKPQLVAHGATAYVAWARPAGASGQPQKLGYLSVDETEVGRLQAATPLKDFDLIVSAEPMDAPTMNGEPVLTGHVERK